MRAITDDHDTDMADTIVDILMKIWQILWPYLSLTNVVSGRQLPWAPITSITVSTFQLPPYGTRIDNFQVCS